MNKLVLILLLLTLAMNVTAEKAETWTSDSVPKKIKMCWHNGYPYAASDMVDGGLAADFTSTVMAEAGFETEVIFVPWARCKIGAKKGLYDMLFSMWNDVNLHQQDFDFFYATDIEYTSFVVLDNSPLKSGELKDLHDVRVALHNHGGYSSDVLSHKGFEFHFVDYTIQKVKMLARGRVDVIIGDPITLNYELKHNVAGQDITFRTLLPHIQVQRSSPAIAKNNPHGKEIIRRYNDAYLRLCERGVLQHIIDKHGFDFEPVDCPD
mgnify:CR=1 FL=1